MPDAPSDLRVRLMKVDAEGGELPLFRGALRTLREHKPYLAFELSRFHPAATYDFLTGDAGLSISTLDDWLAGRRPLDRESFLADRMSTRNYFYPARPSGKLVIPKLEAITDGSRQHGIFFAFG
jgi:Methyltransferase FkbM domain